MWGLNTLSDLQGVHICVFGIKFRSSFVIANIDFYLRLWEEYYVTRLDGSFHECIFIMDVIVTSSKLFVNKKDTYFIILDVLNVIVTSIVTRVRFPPDSKPIWSL